MRKVAVVNQKGGSGKTTSAVNLGAALAEAGQRVLLIDLDPQASATAWCGVVDGGPGLLHVFTENGNVADLVGNVPDVPGLSLVPSSAWLLGVEKALAGEVGAETILRTQLERLPKQFDVVLMDCPPTLGILAVNALVAATEALIPVEASTLALAGLAALWRTLERVRERLNPELEVSGILACRVDLRTNLSRDIVARLREKFGELVFRAAIRETVRLRECPSFTKPITLYDPQGAGAEDYRAAASEFIERGRRKRHGGKEAAADHWY